MTDEDEIVTDYSPRPTFPPLPPPSYRPTQEMIRRTVAPRGWGREMGGHVWFGVGFNQHYADDCYVAAALIAWSKKESMREWNTEQGIVLLLATAACPPSLSL